jgi:hypothetical protein
MRLWIDEEFGMNDSVGMRAVQVSFGHCEEIVLGDDHRKAPIEYIPRFLEIAEPVGSARFLDVVLGQRDVVAASEVEQYFRFDRALNVHVELNLGQPVDCRENVPYPDLSPNI